MSPETISLLIAIGAFFVLVLLEVPIGLATALAGIIGITVLESSDTAANVIRSTPYSASAKYALFVVPMYILLGALIANVGIGAQIYGAVNRFVGRLPGGLAATAVLATGIFSGISGSSAADVATFGRISVTEMSRHGYDSRYASSVVAAAGTFAVLIPPSIVLVIYGIIAEESIGALLLAAIIPGAISCAVLAAFVILRAVFSKNPEFGGRPGVAAPEAAPADALPRAGGPVAEAVAQVEASGGGVALALAGAPGATVEAVPPTRRLTGAHILGLFYAAVLFAIVLGGLYSGTFTATEAGAVGAFVAVVIALLARAPAGTSKRAVFASSLRETADVTSMIFLLLIGGAVFTYFLVYARFPTDVAEWAINLPLPEKATVGIFLLMLLVLGMFLDSLSILLITVPIAAPVVVAMGFDGVWFGILVVKMIEIGLITPPVGINVFIIAGVMNQRVEDVFRRVAPFVVLDLAVTAVFFFVPDLVLWLPRQAGLA